jgi:peptide/nickel transport system ATP-binding protein
MSEVIVEVKDLSVSFFTKMGEVKAVDKISYSIKKGKILGIVGESGCGKSVTSFTMMGLLAHPGKIVGGEILFKGDDLAKYSESDYQALRGNKIAMIFQEPMTALNPVLTIGYQIEEQVLKHRKVTQEEATKRAIELLDLVGIPSPEKRIKEYPHQLSGGMKQRAMIAMALSCDPEFLIADEPTTALDVTIQAQILDLIQSLQEKFGMTVQFITHDLGVISELADDVIVMYSGRIVESGPADEIFAKPSHPYTQGLLASLPKFKERKDRLYAIPGNVPSPLDLPPGCAFYNRCPYAKDKCFKEVPPLNNVRGNLKIACFYPNLDLVQAY